MKQYCEDAQCDDGFHYELWRRMGINGDYLYYPVCCFSKIALLGGCLFSCPEELKRVMNLPR